MQAQSRKLTSLFGYIAEPCRNDPLMLFPFGPSANDLSCKQVQGTLHGDAYVDPVIGALVLDGDGDYMSVSTPFIYAQCSPVITNSAI